MKRRYPLEPLRVQKKRESEERVRRLSAAAAGSRSADDAARLSGSRRALAEKELAAGIASERKRLDAGLGTAGEAALASRWRARAAAEVQARADEERAARARATAARRVEDRARDDLLREKAGELAVDEHRKRWERTERIREEGREHDAAADARAAKGAPQIKGKGSRS